MKIHTFDVGPGHPVFVVAEGGSNHGGSLDAALALTDAAADAGANSMKWQLWLSADEMYDRAQFPEEWASAERYRLPAEWLPALRDRAHERGMAFGLSSFGFASLDEADKWVDFHKVASIESTWKPFVVAVRKKKKPTIISLGMQDARDEIWGRVLAAKKVIWLHCTVAYPCGLEDAHIAWTREFQDWEDDIKSAPLFGLSDHTLHPTIAPCAAVALGACVIEKHIRLNAHAIDWTTEGSSEQQQQERDFIKLIEACPDYSHSLDRYGFSSMVESIRLTEQALGSSKKRIRESEMPYLKYRRGPKGLRGA